VSTRVLSSFALFAVFSLVAGCSGGSSAPSATPTPETPGPEVVIGQWVRANRNVDFIGLCQNATPGVDVGKLCTNELGSRGTRRAYALGPTFSEPTAIVMVEQAGDGTWKVLSVTNRDPSQASIPGIDWPLEVGDEVVVIGVGDCLNIREQPTQQGKQLNCVPDGTKAIIQDGPKDAETFRWWRIAGDGFNGWAAGAWLRLPDAVAAAYATAVTRAQGTATPTPSQ
jgi:hypothetical protein